MASIQEKSEIDLKPIIPIISTRISNTTAVLSLDLKIFIMGLDISLNIKNRTAFRKNKIFDAQPKGQKQIDRKAKTNGHKRYINKRCTYDFGTHPKTIGNTLANMKSMTL